jgi:hypothetical protein
MARTNKPVPVKRVRRNPPPEKVVYTEEDLVEAYRAGRRGRPNTYSAGPVAAEWQRGRDRWQKLNLIAVEALANDAEVGADIVGHRADSVIVDEITAYGVETPKVKRRRTVAPGDPPKQYSGHEYPRGGHVRLNNEDEEAYCWARKIRWEEDGVLWVSGASCAICIDKGGCTAWTAYRKHLREEIGV